MSEETHEQRHARFARIRRTKWLLRFTPRRALFHRYPVIGRFADVARKRSHLWSFRTDHVRPALYIGSITAFMPIMGVQLPVALFLALVLRCNFMVMAGLQFITNPFTAAPIYIGTYQLGQAVIEASGFGQSVELAEDGTPVIAPPAAVAPEAAVPPEPAAALEPAEPERAPPMAWTRRFGTAINALVLGGVIAGVVCGLILDLIWRFGAARAAHHRERVARRKRSGSTGRVTPPM